MGIILKGRFGLAAVFLCILVMAPQNSGYVTQPLEIASKIDIVKTAEYIDHEPFVVDLHYLENNCTGTGTAEDPFIIENLRIEYNQSCITVGSLDSILMFGNGTVITTFYHLVIRNCLFVGIPHVWPTGDVDLKGTGVRLHYNAHNVSVINNRFERLWFGVYVFHHANNNIVKGNYFNCSYGIRVDDLSPNNIFCDNEFEGGPDHPNPGTYGNGQHGVSISRSWGNQIYNNTFSGLDNCGEGRNADNTTVFNNTMNDSFYNGFDLQNSTNVVIANNTFMYNYYMGIWVDEDSEGCVIANNTFAYNGHGFEVPSLNTTTYSYASDTPGRGIWITQGSTGNEIKYNDLIYNQVNTLDEVPGNVYDFNFWTDYSGTDSNDDNIGDTPYYVAGSGGGVDTHPSMIPWGSVPPVPPPTPTSTLPTYGGLDPMATMLIVGGTAVSILLVSAVIVLRKRST